jgi:hypothetical protein
MSRGEKDLDQNIISVYSEFYSAVKLGEAFATEGMIDTLQSIAVGEKDKNGNWVSKPQWLPGAWLPERVKPNEFSKRTISHHHSKGEFTIDFSMNGKKLETRDGFVGISEETAVEYTVESDDVT